METKVCFKCGKEKPLTEFYKHSAMKDGYLNKCKECNKIDVKENYKKNRLHYFEYESMRSKKEERKKKQIQYQKKRRNLNPEKYIAHCAVNNAIRDGRLKKKPCQMCGNEKTEAHHPDYNNPLNVIWLCRKCHLEVHNKILMAGE